MFEKNVRLLGEKLSLYLSEINKVKESDTKVFEVVDSKTDVPTLKANINDRELFIHSKYNPKQEAERIVNNLDSTIIEKDHVIFFGVGLGYHIELFAEKYPQKTFSIVEPHAEVFLHFMQNKLLNNFPLHRLLSIYIKSEEITMLDYLTSIVLKDSTAIIVLPTYERIFKEEVASFFTVYQKALKMTRTTFLAKKAFGKRWIINSLMNLPTTLSTENILDKKDFFEGKPLIIASAGPSLHEDMKYLKYIKENGLAYIFAVGSANKSFIAHNLMPDAVVTYDPQPNNFNVFRELISLEHKNIPMIYGTSVGFETINQYNGPLFHFVNSADTVTNYYLDKEIGKYDVQDATTIALIALQLANLLNAGPIIFAGQNLAFKNDRYYAQGIKYARWQGEVRESIEGKKLIKTIDVYGNDILTNENLSFMRQDIEKYLQNHPHLNVINTTKGGAAIKGAAFEPIEEVIKKYLTTKVVDQKWYEASNIKNDDFRKKQVIRVERNIEELYGLLDTCLSLLQKINKLMNNKKYKHIESTFNDLNKQFNRALKNRFYISFIHPVLSTDFDNLSMSLQKLSMEQNQLVKINSILKLYNNYLLSADELLYEMVVHLQKEVHPAILESSDNMYFYPHNDGVFEYEGDWQRETIVFNDFSRIKKARTLSKSVSTMSEKKGAKIKFRFEGTSLQIFAQKHNDFTNNVKLSINGTEKTVRTKELKLKYLTSPKINKKVFEIKALKYDIYDVCIELLEDEAFHFEGVAINNDGRIYHIDEVTAFEQLTVGKKIRCHISGVDEHGNALIESLGKVITKQMPLNSYDRSYDFYIEKVFEDDQGRSKFISNRNLGIVTAKYNDKDLQIKLNYIPVINSKETNDNIQLKSSPFYETKTNKWDAYKAFNKLNGIGNCWATTRGTLSGWLEVSFNKPTNIHCYTLVSQDYWAYFDSAKRMPKDWILEGWNENDNKWESIDKRNNITSWSVREKKSFLIDNVREYSRYRFRFESNNGDPEFLAIGEIEIV